MDNRDSGTQHKLRMPPELKERLFASAKAMNRSLNAEIVARLEQTFEFEMTAKQQEDIVTKQAFFDLFRLFFDAMAKEGIETEKIKKSIDEVGKRAFVELTSTRKG